MSSYTRTIVKLRQQVTGSRHLAHVEDLLGVHGIRLLHDTLSKQINQAKGLGWEKADSVAFCAFESLVLTDQLPLELRDFVDPPGLRTRFEFTQRCGGRMMSADFSHRCGTAGRALAENSAQDARVQEGVRRVTNRKVNELLCLAMMQPLERQLRSLYDHHPEYSLEIGPTVNETFTSSPRSISNQNDLELVLSGTRCATPTLAERRLSQGIQATVLYRKAVNL